MNFNSMTKQQLIEEIRRRDQRLKELQNGDQVRVTAQRLSKLIAHLPGGVIIETPERKVMQVNGKFCEMFGIDAPPEALQGADCRQAAQQAKVLFTDEEDFITRIDTILAAGKPVLNEELYLRDGRVFERDYVSVEVAPGQVAHLWYYRDVTKRKQAQDALSESEEMFRNFVETSTDLIVRLDKKGFIEYISPRVEEQYGYKVDELTGKHLKTTTPLKEVPRALTALKSVLKGEALRNFEINQIDKSGKIIPMEINAAPVIKNGRIIGLQGIFRDISERKKAGQELRAGEERFRIVAERAPYPVTVYVDDKIYFCNRAAVQVIGARKPEDLLGKLFFDFIHPDSLPLAHERLALLKSGKKLDVAEEKIVTLDGQVKDILVNTVPIIFDNKQALLAQFVDLTERKRAEQELRASEERYRTLFNMLPYGGEVLDRNGIIINLSPNTAKMLAYKPEEMIGRHITEFIDDDSQEIFKQKFPELLKGRPQAGEIRLIRKDGVPLNIMRAATPVFDKSGQVASILALSVDITERVRAEEKIAELAAFNQNIVESAPVGIVTVDVQGKVTSANEAFMQMIGSPGLEETLKLVMNIPSVQKAGLADVFKKTITSGESFDLKNVPYTSHWGKELVVNVKGVAQKNRAGQISGVIVVVDNVTRSVLAEKELKKSEAKFRAIAQTANDAIISVDSSGNIMLWNRGAQQIFGYREEEALGKPLTLLMPQRFKEAHRKGINRIAAGGQTHLIGKTVEVAGVRKNGEEFPLELSLAKWEIGEELYFSAVMRDISQRKLAEAELLWSKRQQETINALLQIPLTEGSLNAKLDAALKVIVKTPLLALQEKGAIFLTDRDGDDLNLIAQHNLPDPLLKICARVPSGHCLCGLAAATRQLQFAGCVDDRHTNQYAGMQSHGHYNVPILSGEKLSGVLVLYLPENYQEKEKDKIFLKAAANTLASIIGHSVAKDTLQQQLTFSQALSNLSQQIIPEQERQNLLEGMARIAGETLGVDRSLIYEIDLEKREARALCEWLNPRAGKIIPTAAAYPLDIFKKSEKRVTTSRHWLESHAYSPNRLFKAEGSDKILHEQMQIKSLLWYPFAFKDHTYYLLAFNHVRESHKWLETELAFVSSLTRLVDMGLMKLRFLEEQARMTSELRRLAAVVEQANETVFLTDPQGNIEYVNPAFEQLSGYSFQEILGKNPRMLKSGRKNEELYENLWRTILSGQAWSGTFKNKRKDGGLFEEEAIVFPIKNDAGQIIHFCKIARDVSKERQLEEQLRRSQKLETIGTLAGGIAHDFNNILTPILGYTDMALFKMEETDPLHHDLQQILKAAHRAKDLVEQILLFAKQSEKERQPLGRCSPC